MKVVGQSIRFQVDSGAACDEIHRSHIGVGGRLRRARESVYWPGMNTAVNTATPVYYNANARDQPPLKKGDTVRIQPLKDHKKQWKKAIMYRVKWTLDPTKYVQKMVVRIGEIVDILKRLKNCQSTRQRLSTRQPWRSRGGVVLGAKICR